MPPCQLRFEHPGKASFVMWYRQRVHGVDENSAEGSCSIYRSRCERHMTHNNFQLLPRDFVVL